MCRVESPAISNANPGWGSIAYVRRNLKDAIPDASCTRYFLNNPGTANGHCECLHFEMFDVRQSDNCIYIYNIGHHNVKLMLQLNA